MSDRYLESLVCPLPEDIARLKGAGEYDLALALIRRRLGQPLPEMLKTRLEAEAYLLPQLSEQYSLTEAELLSRLQEKVEDFTPEELHGLLLDGLLDFRYINGQRRYFHRLPNSLVKSLPSLKRRLKAGQSAGGHPEQADMIRRMKEQDIVFRYRLRGVIRVNAPTPGETYRVHLPLAAQSMQQEEAKDIVCDHSILHLDGPEAPQRTLYTESQGELVTLEFTVTQRPRYVNALDEGVKGPVYPRARPVCPDDLMEIPPHLTFTPYLRSLAEQTRGEEQDPVRAAWAFYRYVTEQVNYSFMPPYLLLESGAEYTAVNLRGDCGLQALLFIALCRISGIPARWQSGLCAEPGDVGSHDWAEFFSPRLGWLPVDCSFGGSAFRAGNEAAHRFYFGNLDPWRMVANRTYFSPLRPEKKFPRADPYDSQRGEIETKNGGLKPAEFSTEWTMLWHDNK